MCGLDTHTCTGLCVQILDMSETPQRYSCTYQVLLFDFYPAMIPSDDGSVIGEELFKHGLMEYILKHHKESI